MVPRLSLMKLDNGKWASLFLFPKTGWDSVKKSFLSKNQSMNLPMNNATMSSREIARVTGKLHKNVMRDIRAMEPAWEKSSGLKFELSEFKDATGRRLPEYILTKTQCLYVATKFNDEARAKLVLRWEALEHQARVEFEAYNRRLEGLENGMSALMVAMTNLTNLIAQNQQTRIAPAKKEPTFSPIIDARHLAFDFVNILGDNIRHIIIDEKDWYSLNDILLNMKVKTGSGQIARKIPSGMSAKIWLYGNTHPAWFCSKSGLDIVMHGSRKLRNEGYFSQIKDGRA